ncbi:unnamed protein product [Paramecium sonneborni]|uniref:Transmembrane protein n=1 Tax=Paramecium sonneborni TaxID=65129 RepID=A0A8S1N2Q1_9CILI|nr:unnamed protein product [Paramecium sonneborni]
MTTQTQHFGQRQGTEIDNHLLVLYLSIFIIKYLLIICLIIFQYFKIQFQLKSQYSKKKSQNQLNEILQKVSNREIQYVIVINQKEDLKSSVQLKEIVKLQTLEQKIKHVIKLVNVKMNLIVILADMLIILIIKLLSKMSQNQKISYNHVFDSFHDLQ